MLKRLPMISHELPAVTSPSLYGHDIKAAAPKSISDHISSVVQKIRSVVEWVFVKAASAFCYWINPTIFACAFFGTIIWAKETKELFKRIEDAWQAQPWPFYCLTAAAAFIHKPVAIVTLTIGLACKLGLTMANKPIMSDSSPTIAPVRSFAAV